jgi:hypothetical protein
MRTKLGWLGAAAWVPFQDMRSRSSPAGGPMEKLYLVLLGIALDRVSLIRRLLFAGCIKPSERF